MRPLFVLILCVASLVSSVASAAEPSNATELKQSRTTGQWDFAADAARKQRMAPDEAAWEQTLEANLGAFYLPLYKRDKLADKETAWDFVRDDPHLPRVLLIGDSISRGYTLPVRHRLAGVANVHRAPENCGATARGVQKLDLWLKGGPWDVIHFNFGIHDRQETDDHYRAQLEQIVARLRQTGAKLIWATTTPLPPQSQYGDNARMVRLNEIAASVMRANHIPVDDLYADIRPHQVEYQLPNDVHYRDAGYEFLGDHVVAAIRQALVSTSTADTRAAIDWPAARNPVWAPEFNVRDPSVIATAQGYQIYYSRFRGTAWNKAENWSVACASTSDFTAFHDDHDVLRPGYASPGDVVRWGGRYIIPFQSYPDRQPRLYFSASSDLVTWSAPQPFLSEANSLPWNGLHRVIDPTFVVVGDTLHCFFVGSTRLPPGAPSDHANLVGHAVTHDPALREWQVVTPVEPLIGTSNAAPDGVENLMIIRTGDHWTMLFSEGLAHQHLARATSADLATWKMEGPVAIPRQRWNAFKYGAPYVWRDGARWIMLLMGEADDHHTTFGILTSPDAVTWTPLPERADLRASTP